MTLAGVLLCGWMTSAAPVAQSPPHTTTRPVRTVAPLEVGEIGLVPAPARLHVHPGFHRLTDRTELRVTADHAEARAVAEFLAGAIHDATGIRPAVRAGGRRAGAGGPLVIDICHAEHEAEPVDDPLRGDGAESYAITSGVQCVRIAARSAPGLFYGAQSFRQLLRPANNDEAPPSTRSASGSRPASSSPAKPSWGIPLVTIEDRPRFRHRGMLLDSCRHFIPMEMLKRYIDLLAYHKMNVLHWHLTEDQGWRIEIRGHPRLTEIGAWRKAKRESEQPRDADGRYGGYYTQDDVREIVRYARSRHVTVIPEIELPGHALAALAAYPELSCTGGPFDVGTEWGVYDDVYCAGNDRVFRFLEDVLDEVIALFPSEYVHIGGDECPKTRWKACSKCQERIKAEGLKDEAELQSWFIRRVERYVNSRGRRLIGWDEILEGGLAPNATVQSWRGLDGAIAAARAGHDVISSPTSHCYLDYAQARLSGHPFANGFLPIERVYQFEPVPQELTPAQVRHVLGIEGNLWTERAPPALLDRQAFPRLCALAEVAWSPQQGRSWEDFVVRMEAHGRRLDALGVARFMPPHDAVRPVPRSDNAGWMARHAELCRRVADRRPRVLFIGDSITQGWEREGKAVWDRHYARRDSVNLGISGDRTQHVLWRLDHGNLAGLDAPDRQSRLAVVMIGTNNSNGDDHTAEQIADGIVMIVDKLRARMPRTRVLLLAVFPRGERPNPQREKNALAGRLAAERLAADPDVRHLDIGPRFVDEGGALSREIMPDFLHLSQRGYEIWAEAIEPVVRELLGE